MPLNLFYTMVQKSQKWPKTQIKGGPALNDVSDRFGFWSPRSAKLGEEGSSIEERAAQARELAIATESIWMGQSAYTIACSTV